MAPQWRMCMHIINCCTTLYVELCRTLVTRRDALLAHVRWLTRIARTFLFATITRAYTENAYASYTHMINVLL